MGTERYSRELTLYRICYRYPLMQPTDELEMAFAVILVVSVVFILAQCLFTHRTIYDVFKSDTYRLVSNGRHYKIQQKCLLVFWVDYYGFAVKREDGCLDITIMSEEQGKEILAALRQQASDNRASRKWKTVA
jgi:hypothetical protein